LINLKIWELIFSFSKMLILDNSHSIYRMYNLKRQSRSSQIQLLNNSSNQWDSILIGLLKSSRDIIRSRLTLVRVTYCSRSMNRSKKVFSRLLKCLVNRNHHPNWKILIYLRIRFSRNRRVQLRRYWNRLKVRIRLRRLIKYNYVVLNNRLCSVLKIIRFLFRMFNLLTLEILDLIFRLWLMKVNKGMN